MVMMMRLAVIIFFLFLIFLIGHTYRFTGLVPFWKDGSRRLFHFLNWISVYSIRLAFPRTVLRSLRHISYPLVSEA